MTSIPRSFLDRSFPLAFAAAILISTISARADILANWKFDTAHGRFDQTSEQKISPEEITAGLAPSIVADGASASPVSLGEDSTALFLASVPGYYMSVTGGSMFGTRPWHHGSENYIEFTVSASEPNTLLNISEVKFHNRAMHEVSNFSDWILYSSLDDFTEPLAGGPINLLDQELELQVANLNLPDVEKITFRLVATGYPTHTQIWIIDDLTVKGSVVPKR